MQKNSEFIQAQAAKIKLLILDVDGILTDGRIWLAPNGEEIKCFHVRDGVGIKQLQNIGIVVAVITGRNSKATALRMKELDIQHYYAGRENKIEVLQSLLSSLNISTENMAYMGDDLPDMEPMKQAALAITVEDAHLSIKAIAHWITTQKGGQGAVREVCDYFCRIQQGLIYEPI